MTMAYIVVIRQAQRSKVRVQAVKSVTTLNTTDVTTITSISTTVTTSKIDRSNRLREMSRQLHLTISVAILVAFIVVSWLPLFIISLIWALDTKANNKRHVIVIAHYATVIFAFSGSSINPLLYCARNHDIRTAAIGVFKKPFKWTK